LSKILRKISGHILEVGRDYSLPGQQCIVRQIGTNISEKPTACIFRIEEAVSQLHKGSNMAGTRSLIAVSQLPQGRNIG